jgi:hypothetical protein
VWCSRSSGDVRLGRRVLMPENWDEQASPVRGVSVHSPGLPPSLDWRLGARWSSPMSVDVARPRRATWQPPDRCAGQFRRYWASAANR